MRRRFKNLGLAANRITINFEWGRALTSFLRVNTHTFKNLFDFINKNPFRAFRNRLQKKNGRPHLIKNVSDPKKMLIKFEWIYSLILFSRVNIHEKFLKADFKRRSARKSRISMNGRTVLFFSCFNVYYFKQKIG